MAFEERAKRALERRKKPVEDDSIISLPDQSSSSFEPKTDAPPDSRRHEASAEARTSKLKYEAGASGFLIVEMDGTKRKPNEAEEDQIIRTEMGDALRDDVPQMELVRVSNAEIAELEGVNAVTEEVSASSEYAKPEQLEEAKKNIHARLEAVKAKIGDKHFKRLEDYVGAATKPIEIKGISEALQVYEASSKGKESASELDGNATNDGGFADNANDPAKQKEVEELLKKLAERNKDLDLTKFEHLAGVWGGRYYYHPDTPGKLYTSEQIQMLRDRKAKNESRNGTEKSDGPEPPSGGDGGDGGDDSENGSGKKSGRGAMPQPLPKKGRVVGVVPKHVKRRYSALPLVRAQSITYTNQGSTMDVILKDKKKQELFGEYVKAHGPEGLSVRHMASMQDASTMEEDDYAELQELLKEFDHRMRLLDEVRDGLTAADVEFMIANDKAFAVLATNLNPTRRLEAMKTALSYTFALASSDDVRAIVLSHRSNLDIRMNASYAKLKERTRHFTGLIGVGPEDLNWSMLDARTARNIRKPGFFRRVLLRDSTIRSNNAINSLAHNRIEIGKVLAGTLSNDSVFRARIVQEAYGKKPIPALGERGEATFGEFETNTKNLNTALDEDIKKLKAKDETFQVSLENKMGKKWADATPDERADAFFADRESDAEKRQSLFGWFAGILSAVFSEKLKQERKKLMASGAFNN